MPCEHVQLVQYFHTNGFHIVTIVFASKLWTSVMIVDDHFTGFCCLVL